MDFPFLNTRLRYSCWATLFRYLPWLIHRSAVSSKSGPTMGVAATTHDHNRLSSVPYYRLSRLARLCPPPITRVSLSLSVWSCRVWWWWWWRWCLSSRRERGQRPRGVVSMIRIERELRGKLRHVSRGGGGVSSSMKFKTSSEREAQTTPRNSCVPFPPSRACRPTASNFSQDRKTFYANVCVRVREKLRGEEVSIYFSSFG